MDVAALSDKIFNYTGGYPFMVSRICKYIDEKFGKNWTLDGVQDAVQTLLVEKNTLFEDVSKNLENNKELYDFMYSLLIRGMTYDFVIDDPLINLGATYGFIKNANGKVAIANKIFELRIAIFIIIHFHIHLQTTKSQHLAYQI